jgi:hypothetical protein
MDLFDDIETALKVCEDGCDALFPGSQGMAAVELTIARVVVRAGFIALLFARFEAEINRRCEILINERKTSPTQSDQRVWKMLNSLGVTNISFTQRLELLMGKGRAEFKRAKDLYKIRNDLVHGVDLAEEHDFLAVATALKSILAAMEENP